MYAIRSYYALDPSFNTGIDVLYLIGKPSDYTAYFLGSNIVICSALGKITIPVGTVGMDLVAPTVVLVSYGTSEAFDGPAGREDFVAA